MQRLKEYSYARFLAVTSFLVAVILLFNSAMAYATVGTSAAAGPPKAGRTGGSASAINIEFQSIQSGNWKQGDSSVTMNINGENRMVSPAWKEFSSKLRINNIGVKPGDWEASFNDYLAGRGLDREMCMQSSVIWVANSRQTPGAYTVNQDTAMPARYGDKVTKELLLGAPIQGGTQRSANFEKIADGVSNAPAIKGIYLPDLKVICSAQIIDEKMVKEKTPKDCTGPNCESPNTEPPTPKNPPFEQTTFGKCPAGTEGRWQGGGRIGSGVKLAAFLTKVNTVDGIFNGVSQIITATGNALSRGKSTIYSFRCQTRYMSYYKVAPATYHTKTEFARVYKNRASNENYGTVVEGMLANGNFKRVEGTMGAVWYDMIKVLGTINSVKDIASAVTKETKSVTGNRKVTGYGVEWGKLPASGNANGGFDNMFKVANKMDRLAKEDEHGKDFSTSVNIPASQQALLAVGGVLNVSEVERQKTTRVVQPYVTVQVSKCTTSLFSLFPCSPAKTAPTYQSEEVNTRLTDANEIALDQLKHISARTSNVLRDPSINSDDSLQSLVRSAKNVKENLPKKIKQCTQGTSTAVAVTLDEAADAVGATLGTIRIQLGGGGILGGMANLAKMVREYSNRVDNITLYCSDAIESANPVHVPDLAGKLMSGGTFAAFASTPGRASYTTNVVPKNTKYLIQRAQYAPMDVSWWQILSVNCNMAGIEQTLASVPGSKIVSDAIRGVKAPNGEHVGTGVGRVTHAVGITPVYRVDPTKKETKLTPRNYKFGRKGTESAYLGFYDKECAVSCSRDPKGVGASDKNNATENTALNYRAPQGVRDGMQVRDNTTKDTYKQGDNKVNIDSEIANSNFVNIFRDNIERRIRIDTWYPVNGIGQIDDYANELNKMASLNLKDKVDKMLSTTKTLMESGQGKGGSSIGILYNGDAPISTTMTRYSEGTPGITDFFNIYAVVDTQEDDGIGQRLEDGFSKLKAGEGKREKIFEKGTGKRGNVPTQKSLSQDLGPNKSRTELSAMFDGLVNRFDVSSNWASEKSLPQIFNIKWEYQTLSAFQSVNQAGFNRDDGTKDKTIEPSSGLGYTLTLIETKCQGLFGTNVSREQINEFQANTGSGTRNNLDNEDDGLISGSPARSEEANFYVNTLRSAGE